MRKQFGTVVSIFAALAFVACSDAGQNADRNSDRARGIAGEPTDTGAPNDEPTGEDPGEGEEPTADAGGGGPKDTGARDTGGAMDTGPTPNGGVRKQNVIMAHVGILAGHPKNLRAGNQVNFSNVGTTDADLSGYIVRSGARSFTIPGGSMLKAGSGGEIVVVWNLSGTNTSVFKYTGSGLGNWSTLEGEVMLTTPGGSVVAYVRWDTDNSFGNAPNDPYGNPGITSPNTAAAVAAGLWDSTWLDASVDNFARVGLYLNDSCCRTTPGVTASDWHVGEM